MYLLWVSRVGTNSHRQYLIPNVNILHLPLPQNKYLSRLHLGSRSKSVPSQASPSCFYLATVSALRHSSACMVRYVHFGMYARCLEVSDMLARCRDASMCPYVLLPQLQAVCRQRSMPLPLLLLADHDDLWRIVRWCFGRRRRSLLVECARCRRSRNRSQTYPCGACQHRFCFIRSRDEAQRLAAEADEEIASGSDEDLVTCLYDDYLGLCASCD